MPTASAAATRTCRILYYGPGGAGKRENLKQIIASVPAEHRFDVAEDASREIAFLLRNGDQGDWRVLVRALDMGQEPLPIPGQPADPPFDGLVFAVHSGVARLDQSLSCFEALKAFLDAWGRDLMSMPLVIQYNRREQPDVLPVDRLESLLNPWGLLSFPASTAQREGVKETLKAILGLSISQILQEEERAQAPTQERGEFDSAPPVPGTDHTPEPPTPVKPAPGPDGAGSRPAKSETGGGGRNVRDLSALAEGRTAFFDELRPPIVVPVRVPRKLIEKHGSVRILLEVQVDDDSSLLG